MVHSLDRTIIIINLTGALIKASIPFIPIVGSSHIIDSLIAKDWNLACFQAAIMILAICGLGLLDSYIQKVIEVKSMTINRLCNSKILLKAISLDYTTFENKKNLEEFQAADYNVSRNGGFGRYMLSFMELTTGIAGFIVSFGFLVRLCLEETMVEGLVGFMVSRTGSFLVIGVLILLLSILYASLSQKLNEKNVKMHYEMMDVNQKVEHLGRRMPMDITVAKDIRLYHMKDMLYLEWKKFSMELNSISQKFWKAEKKFLLLSSLFNDIVLLIAYFFVVIKAYVGALSIGSFTKYIGAVRQMNTSLRTIIEGINMIKLYQSYLSFYTDFMEKKNTLDTGDFSVDKKETERFELEFHNVSFSYPGSEEIILKNVSLKLDRNRHFAIVGRNGAGKSTFIKLLCRLYDATEGYITLNGVDIRKYDYKEYINLFATVFQDFSLFSIPVKDVIACQEDANEKKVWEALQYVGIKERIEAMPDKLNTLLYYEMGKGEAISGGEAQKIAIARALYKNAPFVILDEPTAALDPISEYEIYSHFDKIVQNKTSIFISHRMSSCRFCDDILVFDGGRLIQRGNHEQLMLKKGNLYETLWNAQAKYYENSAFEA